MSHNNRDYLDKYDTKTTPNMVVGLYVRPLYVLFFFIFSLQILFVLFFVVILTSFIFFYKSYIWLVLHYTYIYYSSCQNNSPNKTCLHLYRVQTYPWFECVEWDLEREQSWFLANRPWLISDDPCRSVRPEISVRFLTLLWNNQIFWILYTMSFNTNYWSS